QAEDGIRDDLVTGVQTCALPISDDALIAEAEIVFVCVDRLGRATPLPEEIARVMGPRTSGSHQPIRVTVGAAELGVEVRGDGPRSEERRVGKGGGWGGRWEKEES